MTIATAEKPDAQDLADALRPLRVLFYVYFPSGGIGKYSHELLSALVRSPEVDLELACLPDFRYLTEASYPTWPGLRDISHPFAPRRKARFLIGQVANPKRLCQRASETRADVVHIQNINYLSFPLWGRRLAETGAKICATAHDVRRAKKILFRKYETRQLQEFYRRADALFVHSRSQADDLIDFSGAAREKIHVVPHGPYDHGRPTAKRAALREKYRLPADNAGKSVALFFGGVRDDKNLDVLLESLARSKSNVHLLVAGGGGGRGNRPVEYYRELAKRLGIEAQVTFDTRFIPDEEVPDLFELCDFVALPYSRRFSSQSGVLNVAAQYRRPVLASGAPTFAETVSACDIGVLVEPDDVAALAMGLDAMQSRLAGGHAHEFDRYLRLFSWTENARRTISVYRSLAGSQVASLAGSQVASLAGSQVASLAGGEGGDR